MRSIFGRDTGIVTSQNGIPWWCSNAPVPADIRSEIWSKLWGSLRFNPISALTRAKFDMMAADLATRLSMHFRVDLEQNVFLRLIPLTHPDQHIVVQRDGVERPAGNEESVSGLYFG